MKKFYIDLDDFCEDIFHVMEVIQDGDKAHIVMFEALDDYSASVKISEKLRPFILKKLKDEGVLLC